MYGASLIIVLRSPIQYCKLHLTLALLQITCYICNTTVQNMNQRLQQFLAAENISQAQFADSIDVARASVSHVLAGRNKPGYDFIRSISEHYPRLNLEWLISGKGKMYKQDGPAPVASAPATPQPSTKSDFSGELFGPDTSDDEPPAAPVSETKSPSAPAPQPDPSPFRRSISRIIVFYDDNTYQELK